MTPTPKVPKQGLLVDFFASRAERYGLATILLFMGLFWLKPHIDDTVHDHRQFLKELSGVQSKQAEILTNQNGSVQRIENTIDRTAEMVRDIHGQMVRRPVAASAGQTSPETGADTSSQE